VYPSQTEEQILQTIKQYHYLTIDQIMLATNQTSLRGTQIRLKNLVDNGYLWRLERRNSEQNLPVKPAYTISNQAKIYLEKQGAVVLPSRKPSPYTLDHSLAINDILIRAFVLGRDKPERYKLLKAEHDRDLRVKDVKLPLLPDGFFEIADLEKHLSFPTLLEVDMDTEDKLRWQEKIEKYLTIFGKEAKRVFDFRHPDVLCVTKEDHVAELKRWTEAVIDRKQFADHNKLFWFTHFPADETPEEFFLQEHFLRGGENTPTSYFSM
jgi:hypothetical protein